MKEDLPDILRDRIETGRSIRIDIDSLTRGIDNHRIDVKLSSRYSAEVRKLVKALVTRFAVPNPQPIDQSRLFDGLRAKYQDLMMVLIHRIKTELDGDQIALLQFAPIKYLVHYTRLQLNEEIQAVSSRLAEHRSRGSSDALGSQHRLFWLKKNYDRILYQVCKLLFQQLLRVEDRHLAPIRAQYFDEQQTLIAKALTTPLHYTTGLSAMPLIMGEYSVWSWNADDKDFSRLNANLEKLFDKHVTGLHIGRLRDNDNMESTISELHDELGGLYATQSFLGLATDTGNVIEEEFDWFEIPENIAALFDQKRHEDYLEGLRQEQGFMAARRGRADIKGLDRFLKAFSRMLRANKLQAPMIASQYMRRAISPTILENVDLKVLGLYMSGQAPLKKVAESVPGSFRLNSEHLKSLEDLRATIKERVARIDRKDLIKLLLDISRYRQQLKYYRFAHRAFNRLHLLGNKEDIKLSDSADTLYKLPTSPEVEEDRARIAHHSILKADVRGSTSVTDELQNKGLNPASYFSTRFFDPINKVLESYGANKVFIEGDAIILSFLEYENAPQQWFSVARACGCARDMLKITNSSNRYSTQMNLPVLELGVGICYANNAPRFLYDGDNPIMISGAIGLADRMSGCSWNLRDAIEKGLFNVHVLRIAEGEMSKGEKGQHYLRYNVNGITLDKAGFSKLKTEIALRSLKISLNDEDYLFHVGQFPDAKGRKKDLVIREGKTGLWKDNEVVDDPDSDESFYEVVVNRKVLSLILEKTDPARAGN